MCEMMQSVMAGPLSRLSEGDRAHTCQLPLPVPVPSAGRLLRCCVLGPDRHRTASIIITQVTRLFLVFLVHVKVTYHLTVVLDVCSSVVDTDAQTLRILQS